MLCLAVRAISAAIWHDLFDFTAFSRYNGLNATLRLYAMRTGEKEHFMQTCYNCGKQVSDDVLICPDCGALVRRYTEPPKRENSSDEPWNQPDLSSQNPSRPVMPTQVQNGAPAHNQTVWCEENGRVRFCGWLTFVLVLSMICSGYLALSYGCSLILYYNQDIYAQLLAVIPEFSALSEAFPALIAIINQLYPLFAALLALSLVNLGCMIWFLAVKSRVSWYVLIGSQAVMCLSMLFLSSLMLALVLVGCLAALIFAVRPYKNLLR